ncbi:MAG: hypothetical protein A3D35_01765 [Candidatus Staskawiczbacteria bacterium RIFCSPHIGHO2_02_FULL_34_9]|uniref:Four helix bundle protein n=1 Tax=Candidatus Staskawiczbacteria bacterium RIFCSPHIGHO2_02_FULL_34_9 TaxID=1802206 RepID=A0A1G2I3Y7_9BACT|nr:MAG: hypothetical protein A3D35_01765 [Candidatus Staskawiczbacteria bacterium RIFCSPHIGHO2_02_FULL_34_9]
MATKSFKDLIVWQKSRDLAVKIYKITEQFPKSEIYGLVSQMRRCSVSISSNIAESYHRYHTKDKQRFLSIAFGSGSELESQIEIAKILFSDLNFNEAEKDILEIMKILNKFLTK